MGLPLFIFLIFFNKFHSFALANLNETPDLKSTSKVNRRDGGVPSQNLWCVAKNNAEDVALQGALDWACGAGGADCKPIQTGGPCYDPQNFQSTASYAFNDYYIKHGSADDACDFGNTAALSSLDPSHDNCKFPSSTLVVSNGSFVGTATAGGSAEYDLNGHHSGRWGQPLLTVGLICVSITFLRV